MITTTKIGNDHFMLMDGADIPEAAERGRRWIEFQMGIHAGFNLSTFYRKATTGDESIVARSEAIIKKIEDQMPMSRGWRVIEDVVGAVPNVPAMIAGLPQHMRRRQRTNKDTAPITIFMDLSSSMGIHKDQILERGVVMLALVRALMNIRSVELWVGTMLESGGQSGSVAWRIDTSPMDLARSGYHIADPAMSRLFGYAMCETMTNCHLTSGPWKYKERLEQLRQVAGWHDLLLVPSIHISDPLVRDPIGWLRGVLEKRAEQADAA